MIEVTNNKKICDADAFYKYIYSTIARNYWKYLRYYKVIFSLL